MTSGVIDTPVQKQASDADLHSQALEESEDLLLKTISLAKTLCNDFITTKRVVEHLTVSHAVAKSILQRMEALGLLSASYRQGRQVLQACATITVADIDRQLKNDLARYEIRQLLLIV